MLLSTPLVFRDKQESDMTLVLINRRSSPSEFGLGIRREWVKGEQKGDDKIGCD
jgi:hypothetical protein